MKARKIVLALVALGMVSSVYGVNINGVSSPDSVWIGDEVSITYNCDLEQNETKLSSELDVESPISQTKTAGFDSTSFVYEPPKLGSYSASVICKTENSQNSSEVNFDVKNLSIEDSEVRKPSGTIYTDRSKLEIGFKLREYQRPNGAGTEVTSELDGVDLDLTGWNQENIYNDDGTYILSGTVGFDGSGFAEPVESADLEVDYEGGTANERIELGVKKPFRIRVDQEPTKVVAGEKVKIPVSVFYRERKLRVSEPDYSAYINDVKVNTQTENGKIVLPVPENVQNPADIEITGSYQDEGSTFENSVRVTGKEVYQKVSGEFVDSEGVALNGRIILEGEQGTFQNTFNNGEYSLNVPEGVYDVEVRGIGDFESLKLQGVNVDSRLESFINYADIKNLPVSNIDVISTGSLETTKGFEKATIEFNYDPTKVDSEQNLKVFQCKKYNPDSSVCSGEWSQVEGTVKPVKDFIEVETSSLGGFAIAKKGKMQLKFKPESKYFLSENIEVEGLVEDENGNGVKGAEVTASISGNEDTVTSGSGGQFSLNVKAPSEEGLYDLKLNAEKQLLESVSESYDINVEPKKSVSINLENSYTLQPGDYRDVKVEIVNDGQIELDLSNSLEIDCNSCLTEYKPKQLELKPGEEKKVTVRILVPNSSAGNTMTASFRSEGEKASAEEAFVVNAKALETESQTETETSRQESAGSEEDSGPGLTASFSKSVPDVGKVASGNFLVQLNIASIIIAIGVIGYLKYRRSGEEKSNKHRMGTRPESQRLASLKNEVMEEAEQEADDRKKESEDEVEEDSNVECEECGKEFDSEHGLKVHEGQVH